MTAPTKAQHYVPRFYLAKFCGPNRKLEVYEKRHGAFVAPKSPGQIGFEDFYYSQTPGVADETSQRTESFFQCLESQVGNEYLRICEELKRGEAISLEDKWVICQHIAGLWMRGQWMRGQLDAIGKDLAVQILERQLSDESAVALLNKHRKETGRGPSDLAALHKCVEDIKAGRVVFNLNNYFQNRQLGRFEECAQWFYRKTMYVYIATGAVRFITSDVPVLTLTTKESELALGRSRNFMEQNHAIPLTPDVLVEFEGLDIDQSLSFEEIEDDQVRSANARQLAGAQNWAAGMSKEHFYARECSPLAGLKVIPAQGAFADEFQECKVTVLASSNCSEHNSV